MASQKLQEEITARGGECYGDECLRFGFEAKTQEERQQIESFREQYADVLELDPESTETTIVFRLKETELTQLPKELVGTIFSYLPESEIAERFEGHKELEFAKQYAIENRPSLEIEFKDTPEFYQYLTQRRHLKSLKLIMISPIERLETLMNTIGNLTDLEELSLSEIELTDINNVKAFANALASLGSLKSLMLDNCNLTDEGLTYLAPYLNNLRNLRSLDLGVNPNLTVESLKLLIPTFERITMLGVGFFNDNGHYTLTELIPFLSRVVNLTRLDLWGNEFEPKDMAALATFLSQNPNLQYLDVMGCHFTEDSLKILESVAPNLPHIDIFSCDTDSLILMSLLLKIIAHWPKLKSLTLHYSSGTNGTAQTTNQIAATLSQTPLLDELQLPFTRFSKDDFEVLAPVLQRLPLQRLDLNLRNSDPATLDIFFSNLTGLRSLALRMGDPQDMKALRYLIHLDNLYLRCDNGIITNEDLADALAEMPNLKELVLNVDFRKTITEPLKKLAFSKQLPKKYQYITADFIQSLGALKNLTKLTLMDNIGDSILDQIRLVAPQLTHLEELSLGLMDYSRDELPNLTQRLEGIIGALPALREITIYFHSTVVDGNLKTALSSSYPNIKIKVF